MNIKLFVIVLLVLIAWGKKKQEEVYTGPSEEDVIELDALILDEKLYSNEEPWIVQHYAHWCDVCQRMRPEWAKLGTMLKGQMNVAKIDASRNATFDKRYGIKSYPTVIMIPEGPKDKNVFYKYDGARTADSILEWAQRQAQLSKGFLVERLTSEAKWKELCSDLQIPLCVVVFLPTLLDSTVEERSVYLEMLRGIVNNFRDKPVSFMWAQTGDHQELQDIFSLNAGFPSVILINPMRRLFSIMRSSYSEEHLDEWLQDILNRKGGRKFGQYHKELVFSTIDEADQKTSQVEIEVKEETQKEKEEEEIVEEL